MNRSTGLRVITPMTSPLDRAEFETLAEHIRPELHRYATRMTGSVVDGEDVVQEALIKAYDSLPSLTSESNVRGWLFRITHNKAIDLLRRNRNEPLELLDEYPWDSEPDVPLEQKELAGLAFSVFLRLAPRQRTCVILKDVMGYSLAEISEIIHASVPEIKALLHRGRTRMRELAQTIEAEVPEVSGADRDLLARYVERFNARDFDGVRALLAEDVQLDLIGRVKVQGADTVRNTYFNRYLEGNEARLALGTVEGQLALLVYNLREESSEPEYFMLLTLAGGQVTSIRDYRYARYVIREAEIMAL